MTHAALYSRDQLIAWQRSVPLADNVRARVRVLKIKTRGCRGGTKVKLKCSQSCHCDTTFSNVTCCHIPVITGNRPTRSPSSYVTSSSRDVALAKWQSVLSSHAAPDAETVALPLRQFVVPSQAMSSAESDIVAPPSPSEQLTHAASGTEVVSSSPRQSALTVQATTCSKPVASPSHYGTPSTESEAAITQLSPAESDEPSGTSWWTSLSSDDPAQVDSPVHSSASPSSSTTFLSTTDECARSINRRSERRNPNLVVPSTGRHTRCVDPAQLNFGVLNVCSLGNKVEAVKSLIDDYKVDVMSLTETWHDDSDSPPIRRLRAHGFQVLERARPIPPDSIASGRHVNHGGVAFIVRTGIKLSRIPVPFSPTTFECDCARLTSNGLSRVLAVIYRPGSEAVSGPFFDEIARLIEILSSQSCPILLTGDANVRLDRDWARLTDLLDSFGLAQHVNSPTQAKGGILDIVVTRTDDPPWSLHVDEVGLSDHSLVRWSLTMRRSTTPTYVTSERRIWKDLDLSSFRSQLCNSAICMSDLSNTDLDVDAMAEQYNGVITTILDGLVPVTKITCRVRQSDPWYDNDCRSAKRAARKFERRYKRALRTAPGTSSTVSHKTAWIDALRASHRLVEQKRRVFWRSKLSSTTNPRQLWRAVDSVFGRTKRSDVTSAAPTSDDFAAYFAKKVDDVRRSTQNAPPPVFSVSDDLRIDFSSFRSLTVEDVRKLISESVNKQSCLDPLPTWLLKQCADILTPYITVMFNASLSTGNVPSLFRNAVVTPLIKKQGLDTDMPQNYRPVSSLPVLSKLLERAVFCQLQAHVDACKLLPPQQSAYRRGHSTETALVKVYSDLVQALDEGHQAVLALLDMTAAFDTVDHSILLQRLSHTFRINNSALDWFTSYLSDRSQSVRLRGEQSPFLPVLHGVPQGSVLGPLLFILYTADIGNIAEKHGLSSHFYADDSQLYVTCRRGDESMCAQRVSTCIDAIAEWMASNRLMLNPTKTDLLWCSTRGHPDGVLLTPGGVSVEPSRLVRNLGVTLDEELTLATHVNLLVGRCYGQLRSIRSCRRALTRSAAVTMVNSFIVSRIDYCNSLLAACSQQQLDKLQRVLNCAARVIYGGRRSDHVTPLLRDSLHWLRIRERITFKLCLLVYKARCGLAPSYIADMCIPVATVPTRRALRSAVRGDLLVPRTRVKFGNRAFAVAGPEAWNSLPVDIRSSETVTLFKNRLKTYLFKLSY